MEWDETQINLLRSLWTQGHSAAEIGRRMGVSKGSIVGKAHRLELDARPSPIRTAGSGATPHRPRLVFRLPALSRASHPVLLHPEPQPPPPPRIDTGRSCEWLSGERHHWVKCGHPVALGSSWCTGHRSVVFSRTRVREEAA